MPGRLNRELFPAWKFPPVMEPIELKRSKTIAKALATVEEGKRKRDKEAALVERMMNEHELATDLLLQEHPVIGVGWEPELFREDRNAGISDPEMVRRDNIRRFTDLPRVIQHFENQVDLSRKNLRSLKTDLRAVKHRARADITRIQKRKFAQDQRTGRKLQEKQAIRAQKPKRRAKTKKAPTKERTAIVKRRAALHKRDARKLKEEQETRGKKPKRHLKKRKAPTKQRVGKRQKVTL